MNKVYLVVLAAIALFITGGAVWLFEIKSRSFFSAWESEFESVAPSSKPIMTDKERQAPAGREIVVNGEKYLTAWLPVERPEGLELFSNLTTRKAVKNLMQERQCQGVVSGGFYSPELAPIGWLVSQGEELSEAVSSRFLNGFVFVDNQNRPGLTESEPAQVKLGLQSGPILVADGEPLPLAIKDDEPSRRVVAVLDQRGRLIFMVFWQERKELSGPKLAAMPLAIKTAETEMGTKVVSAINLDGGSASAFLTDELELNELSLTGSFFCLH